MSTITKLIRYWHTIKHLKCSQISWRLYYRFVKNHPSLSLPTIVLPTYSKLTQPIAKKSELVNERACFLNEIHTIHSPNCWNDKKIEKVWLYNLHYFDYLNAPSPKSDPVFHERLILRWIQENPPFYGIGWEPAPLSHRIINWIKWILAGHSPPQAMLSSLYLQARALRKRLEYHLLGNHLIANAKALVFVGCFFQTREATSWLKKGLRLLKKQMKEQILTDGCHFERSPMYHYIILEDFLDIINLVKAYRIPLPDIWLTQVSKMYVFLQKVTHPDNNLCLFNDTAFDIAPSLLELKEYFQRLQLNMNEETNEAMDEEALGASGFVKLSRDPLCLFADVGNVGPSYLPGHAHAQSLTFELAYRQQRILVNSGTSCYGISKERLRQRSTPAHNTICLDNLNSSDVWLGFRVGRRARTQHVRIFKNDTSVLLEAQHDGYQHRPICATHKRQWQVNADELIITDTIDGKGSPILESYLHFHPDVQLIQDDRNHFRMILGNKIIGMCITDLKLATVLSNTTYHPKYGVSHPNETLVSKTKSQLPLTFHTRIAFTS